MSEPPIPFRSARLAALMAALFAAAAAAQTPLYVDDFEAYGSPGEPPGWFDSSPGNPQNEAPGQFKTWPDPVASGNTVFGKHGASDGFTHYRARTFSVAEGFRLEGRMLRRKDKAELGVTFFSSFPEPDAYYLLAQRDAAGTVDLTASGSGAGPLAGAADSGVSMAEDVWYRFVLETAGEASGLRIRAKVWASSDPEPAWQIDALDTGTPLVAGWLGLWGEGSGHKLWDDLTVIADQDPPLIRLLESGVELLDGALFNRTVVPVIEVEDASPVTIEALLDGAPFASGDPVSEEGEHTLTVHAVDAFGNAADAVVGFTIDLTPPDIVAVDPPDGTLTPDPAVVLSGQVVGAATLTIDGVPVPLTGPAGESFTAGPFALAEGERVFLLTAVDAAGNAAQRLHRIVRDSLPPVVTIDQPAAGAVLATPQITVAGSAVDPHLAGVAVNGVGAALQGSAYTASGVPLAEGPNTLTAVAADALGQSASAQVVVVLDTAAPSIRILEGGAPLADGALFNRAVAPVVEVEDATAVTVETILDGAPFVSGGSVGEEGDHTLRVTAVDAAGNTAAVTVGFTIDLTPPELLAVEPPDGTLLAEPLVTLSGQVRGAVAVTVDGAPAALSGETFSAGPFTLAEGERTFLLAATDAAGNRAERSHTLELDSTPPLLTVTVPAPGAVFGSSPVEVVGTAGDPHLDEVRINGLLAVLAGESFTGSAELVEGPNTLEVVALDAVGNRSDASVSVVLDTVAPSIRITEGGAILADGARFNRPVVPMVEVEDATEVATEVLLNGLPFEPGSEVSADGEHELAVTATDAVGNTASAMVAFTIDRTPPTFVSVAPPEGTLTAEPEVVLQVRVVGASTATVDGVAVELQGETFVTGPLPLVEGPNSFLLAASDEAGNAAERLHRVVRDSTPPAVTLSQPADGALLGESSVTVRGAVTDANLESVRVNGVDAAVTGDSFVAFGVPLSEGDNEIEAAATDAAGNVGRASRSVTLDSLPPTIAIDDPTPSTVTREASLVVRGTVEDPHLDRVEVAGVRAELEGERWSAEVALEEGATTLTATAVDAAGNRADAAVTVLRDATAPQVEITEPAEGARLSVETVEVRGTVDAEEGVTVTLNGLPATVEEGAWSVAEVPLVDGENRLTARAVDAAGNEGVRGRTVFRDLEPPLFVSSDPVDGALGIPLDTAFRLTFSEPLAEPAPDAVRLETGSGTGLDASLTPAGPELTLRPQAELPSGSEVRVVIGPELRDLAGNALANPGGVTFVTADVAPPEAPTVDPPATPICAAAVTLTGVAEPGSRVEVAGGAATARVTADEEGRFGVTVPLIGGGVNLLEARAVDTSGNRSAAGAVEVVHDCVAPTVISARREGDTFIARFSERVDPASVAAAGAVELVAQGALPGSASATADGREAVFVPDEPPPEATLRLSVSPLVRDLAGNPLAFPFSQLFGASGGPSFLTGTAIDDASGRPLAGAVAAVTASDGAPLGEPLPQATTMGDGRFQVTLAPGTHDLSVGRPGYTPVFRVVTTVDGRGTDVFDPRLTPRSPPAVLGPEGGLYEADGLTLEVAAGALTAPIELTATRLEEQALPALLPYGWSPLAAAWVDLGGVELAVAAELSLPVEGAAGRQLEVAELDLATLQWRSLGPATVEGGRIAFPVTRSGGVAAVAADAGAMPPPPAIVGEALGSSPRPVGDEVVAAELVFDPEVVLPSQTSRATVTYTLAAEAASGLPLTLVIEERLTLLDGSERREAPFRADLVLYDAPSGGRSVFRLRPSLAAQALPLQLGTEDVTVVPYGGETVRGNVLGPDGGTATSAEGDAVDFPAGALPEPTAVILERAAEGELPPAVPEGTLLLGALRLELGDAATAPPLTLRLAADPPPAPGEAGLLIEVLEIGSDFLYRPVAELVPAASGWSTAPIDAADLPWPGVHGGGLYLFVRLEEPFGFLRGRALGPLGQPRGGVLITAGGLLTQLSAADGSYVLPVPLGTVAVAAEDPATTDAVLTEAAIVETGQRLDLDLRLRVLTPEVIGATPADGAVDVPPGVEPQLRFSEPVDRGSLAAGIELLQDGEAVPIGFDHQGSLVTVRPESTLRPGRVYELRVGLGVRDLQGNNLGQPVTIRFTTLRILQNEDIDVTRVLLVTPDEEGVARVLGAPGSVPSGALVFVENTTSLATTVSVTAAEDGSFGTEVEASLSDVLLLHVVGDAGEDVVVELGPFRTEDLRGAVVGPEETLFSTVDDVLVFVPEGAFEAPTVVRVEPRPIDAPPAPAPEGFEPSFAFEVDFGGAAARRGLRISVPAPEGAAPGTYLLSRAIDFFGEPAWQMDDLAVLEDGRLTTEEGETEAAQAIVGILAEGMRAATEEGIAKVRSGGLAERILKVTADGARQAVEPLLEPKLSAPRRSLPGMLAPRRGTFYQLWRAVEPLGFLVVPFGSQVGVGFNTGLLGFSTAIDAAVARILPGRVTIPSRLGTPFVIEVRDLATGFIVGEGEVRPPEGEGELVELLPSEAFDDGEPPFPVGGSPLRFFLLEAREVIDEPVGAGIAFSFDGETLAVTGEAGAAQPDVQLRLLGLDDGVNVFTRSDGAGAFQLSAAAAGRRYVLALGARIDPGQSLEIGFNEAIADGFPGIAVHEGSGPDAPRVPVALTPVGSQERVRITPATAWRPEATYTLKLLQTLADVGENRWDRLLELELGVLGSEHLNLYPVDQARDVARLGNLLFVAGFTQGLVVLDASDPSEIRSLVPGDVRFPFPMGVVRGVAVDPHGRVIVTGGGDLRPGELRVFDPLLIDVEGLAANPADEELRLAPWEGATQITADPRASVFELSLPPGTPRRVAVLSNDLTLSWRLGDPPPGGLIVTPEPLPEGGGAFTVTVAGQGGTAHQPVTLRDATLGRWNRVRATASGSFSVPLEVEAGDRVELLINQGSVAYVAINGAGVGAVDVNAVYQEPITGPNPTISDVLSVFVGEVFGAMARILNLGILFDPENRFPLTIPNDTRGITLLEAPPSQPAAMQLLNIQPGETIGLEVLPRFRFDLDGDGELEAEEERDYLVTGSPLEGVFVYDVTDRLRFRLVSRILLPGNINHVGVDATRRRVYAAGFGGGLYVADLGLTLSTELLDANADGIDDRVLETVDIEGITRSPIAIAPELGLLFVGGGGPGLNAVATGGPRLRAVVSSESGDGTLRQVTRLAPLGVPNRPFDVEDPSSPPPLRASFRLLADLPGSVGPEVRLDVVSLGPGGLPIFEAGDPAAIAGLPRARLAGDDGVVLRRLSDDPAHPGYNSYRSEEVAVIADLRAARAYELSEAEDNLDLCPRCDGSLLGVGQEARELLSGHAVAVRFPTELRQRLAGVYDQLRLDGAEIELASVPWEISPAVRQEPTRNPSFGSGDVVPGTLLHSGEMSVTVTDLFLKGRGFDFAFARTYRNQTVGAGPLGPGWDHVYNQRLRELPDGSVEYFDGRGRRELFQKEEEGEEDRLVPPPGLFVDLQRTASGWVMIDSRRRIRRFDRFGRLVGLIDPVKDRDSEDNGTEIELFYDPRSRLVRLRAHGRELLLGYDDRGRLTRLSDFTRRAVRYEYDGLGRLVRVTSPEVNIGESRFPGGLTTTYGYGAPSGDLASRLTLRDNLTSVTDARGLEWLTLAYTDQDGDGRAEEVTTQTWGAFPVGISYDFEAQQTEVLDRRGQPWRYRHDAAGHPTSIEDPSGATTTFAYSDQGILTRAMLPSGRETVHQPPEGEISPRLFGNLQFSKVLPGNGGTNGSSLELVTDFRSYQKNVSLPTSILDPAGNEQFIVRNEAGLPVRTINGRGSDVQAVTTIDYNAFGQQQRVVSPNGHVTALEYYEVVPRKGYLKQVTVDPGGLDLTTSFEVDERGNVTAVDDPRGVRHEFVYNELDWLVEERWGVSASGGTPPVDFRVVYLYDANGNVIEVRRGVADGADLARTQLDYGLLNEVTEVRREVTAGAGDWSTEQRFYDEGLNLTEVVAPAGQTTRFEYDARNLLERQVRGAGTVDESTESFGYDADGRQVLRTDGNGDGWRTEYDGYGRVRATFDPLGNQAAVRYDDNGNPTQVRSFDAEGRLLAFEETRYDALNRPREVERHLWNEEAEPGEINPPEGARGLLTTSVYDGVGNVVAVSDPRGVTTRFEYDAAERLVAIEDALGNRSELELDAGGNVLVKTDRERLPGGGFATVLSSGTYDALGRRSEATDGLGNTSRFFYDVRGNVTGEIDASGQLTVHRYDALDRRTETVRPAGIAERFVYDASSRLLSLTDALGNATLFAYDDLDRQLSITYADGSVESFIYDGDDNPIEVVDGNGTRVVQEFDAAERLTSRTVSPASGVVGPQVESFGYDGLGRLRAASSGAVSTFRSFDSLSRLTSEETRGRTVSYGYDDSGNLTRLLYPSGRIVELAPDGLNRTAAVSWRLDEETAAAKASYSYRGPSLVAGKTLGPGLIAGGFTYDAARRLIESRFADASGATVFQESLTWTPRSLKASQSRGDLNGMGFRFGYDAAGRLTEALRSSVPADGTGLSRTFAGLPQSFAFGYDAAENLLSKRFERPCAGDELALPLDGSGRNRPGQVDGRSLVWNASGDLTEKGALRLSYDFRDRLSRVQGPGGEVASYEYDAFDRRVAKRVGGVSIETVWAGLQPIEEYRGGVLASRRTYGVGLDEIVSLETDLDGDGVLENEAVPFYDETGNVALVTAPDGRLLERYEYSPYGERWVLVDSTPPMVEQVRVRGEELWIELSEEVLREELERAHAAGELTLRNQSAGADLELVFEQPVRGDRESGRRLVIRSRAPPGDDEVPWPTAGSAVELTIPAAALRDLFGNVAAEDLSLAFTWPAGDAVVEDRAAPRVVRLCVLADGRLELELSEEPDLSRLAEITVNGELLPWTLDGDRYTLRSDDALDEGAYTLTIGPGPLDLAGRGLEAPFAATFTLGTEQREQLVFAAPEPGLAAGSTIQNPFGFHGLYHDAETGFVYARRRYLDPEIGRFITTDPVGFADGPSLYQFALNDPVNLSDPTGEIALVDNIIGGVVSVGIGIGVNLLLGEEINASTVALDFGLGFATSGLSTIAKVAKLSKLARYGLRAGAEVALDVGAGAVRETLQGREITAGGLVAGSVLGFGIGEAGAAAGRTLGRRLFARAAKAETPSPVDVTARVQLRERLADDRIVGDGPGAALRDGPDFAPRGRSFERAMQERFANKIIRRNEDLFDEAGNKIGEIDFETTEALVEAGISLGSKSKQLFRLAEEARRRGKRLDVLFDPADTPAGRLSELQRQLRAKFGNRVRFIPQGGG